MENDINTEIMITSNDKIDCIYKLKYPYEKVDNNVNYQKWKRLMIEKYGKDAKLFRCIDDKIIFCTTYIHCVQKPSFKGKCPICEKYICLFCFNNYKENREWVQCCLRRALNKAFFYYSLRYIKNYDKDLYLDEINFIIFIPGINFMCLFIKIIDVLYLDLPIQKSLIDNSGELYSNRLWIEKKGIFVIVIGLLLAFSIILSIIFFFYNTFLIFIIVFISMPFNSYPIKYYYGLISSYI